MLLHHSIYGGIMRKLMIVALFALFAAHPSFAMDPNVPPDEALSPDCEAIAKACLDGGYPRDGGPGKAFWHDCMRPILFGQTVTGVTIDAKVVRNCRNFKIKNLQEQLDQLNKYKNK